MVGCWRIDDQGHFNSSGPEDHGARWRLVSITLNPGVPFLGSLSSIGNQFTTPKELSKCITHHGLATGKIYNKIGNSVYKLTKFSFSYYIWNLLCKEDLSHPTAYLLHPSCHRYNNFSLTYPFFKEFKAS